MKLFLTLLFSTLCTFFSSAQESEEYYYVENIRMLEDKGRTKVFEEVLTLPFSNKEEFKLNIQSKYWLKFQIDNPLNKKKLFLRFWSEDNSDVYVPVVGPDKYRHYKVGYFAKRNGKVNHMDQLQWLTINADSIDFSRSFYFNSTVITHWAKANWAEPPIYFLSDNEKDFKNYISEIAIDSIKLRFYLGVVFASFFLFMASFLISQYKSYLIYGLYLFSIGLYYANRQPEFLTLYFSTYPSLFYNINQSAQITSSGLYIWFVFYFLDVKNGFPKVHKFMLNLLYGILGFAVLYTLILIFFPFFPFRFLAIDLFRIIVGVSSVGLFIYLMSQKPDNVGKIILVGSLVLTCGNIASLLSGDFTIFLKIVVIEIVLFSIVVAIRNKQIDDRRIKNLYDLKLEKHTSQNLKELNEAKNRFYENITHEFRTPLTLILSPIEKKLSNNEIIPEERKAFTLIKRNAQRLLGLINQMMDLAKLEDGNLRISPNPGNIEEVVQPIVEVHALQAKDKNISFDYNLMLNEGANAWFDTDVIEKICNNLLANALKYSPQGGSVSVKTLVKEGQWILEVSNSVNPNVQIDFSRLFQRHYRADEQIEGVGIGLNLTKELVNLAGGNIEAKQLLNHAIMFTVSLPLDKPTTEIPDNDYVKEEILVEEVSEMTPGGQKLLVVEDNTEMRSFIVSNFKDRYSVLEAENGEIGMKIAEKELPNLIISDVMMPKMDGFEFCDTLKQNILTSHIPVILLTAKVGEENEIMGFKTGADAYITKPFSVSKLVARTQQLISAQKRLTAYYKNSFGINPELAISNTEADFLGRLKLVLEEHITNSEFNTEDFSRLMQMSRRQLHRKLKAISEMTPTEYVRNQRLKLAADLLTKSDATIAEIGYEVGFNSPSYFIKSFKEVYGYTPNEHLNRS